MDDGMKMMEYWHAGVCHYKLQRHLQLHPDEVVPHDAEEEGFDPDTTYEEFAVLEDVQDFIQEAIRRAEAAADKPKRRRLASGQSHSSLGAARHSGGMGKTSRMTA